MCRHLNALNLAIVLLAGISSCPDAYCYDEHMEAMIKHDISKRQWKAYHDTERRSREKRMSGTGNRRRPLTDQELARAAEYTARQTLSTFIKTVAKATSLDHLYPCATKATRTKWSKLNAAEKQKVLAGLKNWTAKARVTSAAVDTTSMVATIKLQAPGITGVHFWTENRVWKFNDTFKY